MDHNIYSNIMRANITELKFTEHQQLSGPVQIKQHNIWAHNIMAFNIRGPPQIMIT